MSGRLKKLPALLAGLLLMFCARFLPAPGGLSPDAMEVLGIFLGTVVMWLFVDISWPSVLALLALSRLPGVGTAGVIAASFGNTTIWFLVFSFLITFTLSETGFLRRAALLFLMRRCCSTGTRPWEMAIRLRRAWSLDAPWSMQALTSSISRPHPSTCPAIARRPSVLWAPRSSPSTSSTEWIVRSRRCARGAPIWWPSVAA